MKGVGSLHSSVFIYLAECRLIVGALQLDVILFVAKGTGKNCTSQLVNKVYFATSDLTM